MIERDKEYYNQKISDLYAVIENQEKIIRNLQEEVKDLKSDLELYENGVYFSSENDKLQQRIEEATKIIENDTDLNLQRQRQRLLEILRGNNE